MHGGMRNSGPEWAFVIIYVKKEKKKKGEKKEEKRGNTIKMV